MGMDSDEDCDMMKKKEEAAAEVAVAAGRPGQASPDLAPLARFRVGGRRGSDGRKWDMALPALEPIAAEEMG
ncbi:hypothetical protein OsJ_28347 [Oryza sativa Japonica Group]|uniref:Uncharacterized protein n=1 Tax=Oryza sativa subsp. japonica TaxID=39947 RepID=A3BVY0_ORYSJ|nr:hypothetical protein OsJ_28347 [Oryza sativa Japonica Group]